MIYRITNLWPLFENGNTSPANIDPKHLGLIVFQMLVEDSQQSECKVTKKVTSTPMQLPNLTLKAVFHPFYSSQIIYFLEVPLNIDMFIQYIISIYISISIYTLAPFTNVSFGLDPLILIRPQSNRLISQAWVPLAHYAYH